jgi:hypothetical protein
MSLIRFCNYCARTFPRQPLELPLLHACRATWPSSSRGASGSGRPEPSGGLLQEHQRLVQPCAQPPAQRQASRCNSRWYCMLLHGRRAHLDGDRDRSRWRTPRTMRADGRLGLGARHLRPLAHVQEQATLTVGATASPSSASPRSAARSPPPERCPDRAASRSRRARFRFREDQADGCPPPMVERVVVGHVLILVAPFGDALRIFCTLIVASVILALVNRGRAVSSGATGSRARTREPP